MALSGPEGTLISRTGAEAGRRDLVPPQLGDAHQGPQGFCRVSVYD